MYANRCERFFYFQLNEIEAQQPYLSLAKSSDIKPRHCPKKKGKNKVKSSILFFQLSFAVRKFTAGDGNFATLCFYFLFGIFFLASFTYPSFPF